MKLLLDQNLSPRLVSLLADLYPGSTHVRDVGLATGDDETIWRYAQSERLIITSKDADFRQRAFLFGPPPKVIWLKLGNCSTDEIEKALRARRTAIEAFAADPEAAFLIVS